MLTHVSINLFPIVMLLIIYVNNHKKVSGEPGQMQFDILTLLTLALLVTGIISYGLEEIPGKGANTGLWISYMIYTLMIGGIASTWFVYISYRLKIWMSKENLRRAITYLCGLNILFAILVVTTPWTRLVFYITEDNRYQTGKGYYLIYLISALLLLASMLVIVRKCRREADVARRAECYYMLGCGVPSLVGLTLQYFFHDWWTGAPCLSLTILFIYLNTQNRQITTDELTGLNNRREFDQQLTKKAEQMNGSNWGVLMLDVNDFKKINDSLGHIVGDEALWETADILRRALGKEKSFLARYGGDEFAVIGEWADERETFTAIEKVEQEVEHFNKETGKTYKLSFSIGYAMRSEADDTEDLVKKADERMYLVKARKKEAAKYAE